MTEQEKIDPRNVYISGTSRMKSAKKQPKKSERALMDAEGLNEDEIARRVAEMKEYFDQWNRAIKTIGIYRHNTAHYGEYLEKTYRMLARMLEKYGSIALKVEQLGFKYFDVTVWEDEPTELNFAHKFYRDGVRILILRQGLSQKELLNFVLICLTNFYQAEMLHEDMVSLMWKSEFENIEYVVVETFAVGVETEEQAKAEVDKIVNYLYKRLTAQTDDHFSFARISLEDLEIELDDVEQAKGVKIKGITATSEDKSRVQLELDEEDANRMLPKLVVILFKVLEEELDQDLGMSIEEVFIQLLDSFLMHEDFRGINQMIRKFKGMARKKLPTGNLARIQQVEERFVAKMGEAERIERVGTVLESMAEIRQPQEVYRYLNRLDEHAVVPMLQTLEHMERLEARRLFCDALAVLGKDHLDVFARRLDSTKANLVRDMLYVIDKLNPPDKLKIIARLLDHPNLAIRLEALNTIGAGNDETCRVHVMKALQDTDTQMRITAARLLPNFDLAHAVRTLLKIVKEPDFSRKPVQEQTAVYAALAMTNAPDAMDFFREQLRSSALISKKKHAEFKRIVVNGLAMSGSIAAYKLLKAELEAGIREEDVAASAERACNKLREKLLGS